MIEKLYTVEEVAELASVTGRTIRNYLKSGRLVGRKIGGQWRFPETEVQRLLTGADDMDAEEDESAFADTAPVAQAVSPVPAEPAWVPNIPELDEIPKMQARPTPVAEYLPPAPLPNPEPLPEVEIARASAPCSPQNTPPMAPPAYIAAPAQVPVAAQPVAEPRSLRPQPAPAPVPPPAALPVAPPITHDATSYSQPIAAPAYEDLPPPQREYRPLYQAEAKAAVPPASAPPAQMPAPQQSPAAPAMSQPEERSQYRPPVAAAPAPAPTRPEPAPAPTQGPSISDVNTQYSMPQSPLYASYIPPYPNAQFGYAPSPYSSLYGQAVAVPMYPPQNAPGYYGFPAPAAEAAPPAPAPAPKAVKPEPPAVSAPEAEPEPSPEPDYPAPSKRPAPPDDFVLSDVGKRVSRFISEVHDCSSGPLMCTVIDMYMSLSSAKSTSERLVDFARQESENGTLCQSYVEYDERYYVARFTLFGSSSFLHRCLQLIG